jgi:hypothetical protein
MYRGRSTYRDATIAPVPVPRLPPLARSIRWPFQPAGDLLDQQLS